MRVGLDGDRSREVRRAGVLGRGAPREARAREIESAPEEVDRARLAHEARLVLGEDGVRRDQRLVEAGGRGGVVVAVMLVTLERRTVLDLHRRRPEIDPHLERVQPRDDLLVEARDALRLERDLTQTAHRGRDAHAVIDEIEVELQATAAIGHERGGEPARAHVERHVPPVVARGREREPDLADDLREAVQRLAGRPPRRERDRGPRVGAPSIASGGVRDEVDHTVRRRTREPRSNSGRDPGARGRRRARSSPQDDATIASSVRP